MRKIIFEILLFAAFFSVKNSATSCEVCGCGPGSAQLGYLPYQQLSFLGTSYHAQLFESIHPGSDVVVQDQFRSLQIWGRYAISKKWNIQSSTSYNRNQQDHQSQSGFGDAQVTVQKQILQKGVTDTDKWQISSFLGAGIKLPTGKFDPTMRTLSVGTGTWDGIFSTLNWVQHKKIGISWASTARLNSVQEDGYKFGNSLNTDFRIYHWKKWEDLLLVLSTGVFHRIQARDISDTEKNFRNDYSGGSMKMVQTGVDLYYQKIAIRAAYRQPWTSNLSKGYTTPIGQMKIDFILFLSKKRATSSANEMMMTND